LQTLAGELERTHPGAAGSLREGMTETLTLTRLGIRDNLKRTLESTNPCESMIECVRRTSRNVKRWQSGEMALRWTAAGMLEAERQFRRITGYRDLAKLAVAIERDHAPHDRPVPDRRGRYSRHRLTVTPGPPSRSSTTNGTSSGLTVRSGSPSLLGAKHGRKSTAEQQVEPGRVLRLTPKTSGAGPRAALIGNAAPER
jgi:hypothetical protein